MTKRILSIILAVYLLLSALPMTAFAADNPQSHAATAPLGKGASDLAPTGDGYNLWLGTTQVTDANKDDILNDGGKAKFDPSTGTLTLDNPYINSFYMLQGDKTCQIYATHMDLKIVGSYSMSPDEAAPRYGFFVHYCNLTLDGNFVLRAGVAGINVSYGDLTIAGGSFENAEVVNGNVRPNAGLFADNITILSDVEFIKAFGVGYAIHADDGMITVNNPLRVVSPEGAKIAGGNIVKSDGKTVAQQVEIRDPNNKQYDLWVGSTQVTSKNKDDILNDGGKAKFDPDTNTLTLDNPMIPDVYKDGNYTSKIYSEEMDLTVKGAYKMTGEESDDGICCDLSSLTLIGTFTFYGKETAVYAYNTLTVGGNSLTAKSSEGIGIEADDITIGSVRTLTAEGTDDGIYAHGNLSINGADTVTAKATGNGSTGIYADADITIDSVTTLTVEGRSNGIAADDNITISGGTVTAQSREGIGLGARTNITINSGVDYVYAEGGDCAMVTNDNIVISPSLLILAPIGGVNDNGYIYQSDGTTIAKFAKIGKPQQYDLWIGGTQVTDANKNDILGDGGKAKYDSSTKTLTLNDPTITDSYEDFSVIYSELNHLTITGKATINHPDVTESICANNLTLSGDFDFTADETPVFVPDGSLTIEDSTLKLCSASGGTALDCEYGDLTVTDSSVTTVDSRIWVNGDIKTENSTINVDTYFYDQGIYAADGVNIKDSTVTVSGSPKNGIVANDGALTISNSTVDAYGSELGIVGRKTIYFSGYQTHITAKGGVIGILGTANIIINSTTGQIKASGSSRAIGSNGLELGSGLSITDADGKALQKSGNKIVDSSGKEATYVVIRNPSASSGYTISGSFTSYLDESDQTFIYLLQNGSTKRLITPTGNSGAYSFKNVANGEYVLKVAKNNHVTREYPITVTGNMPQDVRICPLGDVDGNGRVQAVDAMKAYRHAQGKADQITDDYAFKCADVAPLGNPSGKVQAVDAMMIYRQAQGKHSLF